MLQGVPTMLGDRYRVVERLGRGGMADVYRAEDVVLRRTVAVKVFRGGVEREQHLARFRTEVRTLAALTHPHLVALYDAGGDVTEPWCAMEYVNGGSLADREEALPPGDVARIGEQIASGLAYVHGRGIVHRDVKPSNVLLDSGGDAFLSDFGIARLVDGTRMTQSGLMIGTAAFLSPEQVRGRSAVPESDVYALGLVLLEALTGRREYPGTPVESAVSRLSRPPEVPEEFGSDWVGLIGRMTAQEAADRPDPAEVVSCLRAVARRQAGLAALTTPEDDDAADLVIDLDAARDGGDGERARAAVGARAADRPVPPVLPVPPAFPVPPAVTVPPARAAGSVQLLTPTTPPMPALRPDREADRQPRNLLMWFSPDRRQRVGAGMVAAGAVVAVALTLQLVDGTRAEQVQLGNATGTDTRTSTAVPPAAVAGDGSELQVRRAPVGELPVPVEDQPSTTRETVRRAGNDPRVVAGAATTRAVLRVITPTPVSPSPPPSPTTSSPTPSASASASPSSPTSSGSPTVSPSGGTGDASPSSLPTSSVSVTPGSVGTGTGGGLNASGAGTSAGTGTSSLLGTSTRRP